MNLRVNISFDDPSTGQYITLSCHTNELQHSLEHYVGCFEDGIPRIEDELEITIDQGGDDDFYDLDLPDGADTYEEACAIMQRVFVRALQLL